MKSRPPIRPILLVIAGLLVAGWFSPSLAQSDSDLRRQNEQLTVQVQELQQRLDEAQRDNEALKQRIETLEQQLANARRSASAKQATQPAQEPEKVTVDETVPLNSPRALFKALAASLETTMKDMDSGRPGDAKRRAYIKKLESWVSNMERQHRGPIAWHVRVIDSRPGQRSGERIVTLQPVDPVTDVALGDNFEVALSRTLSDRLANYEERDDLGVLVLRGTLAPVININEQRVERGSFDNPPFLGTFTEFGYVVEVKSIMTIDDDKARAGASTKPADTRNRDVTR